VKLVDISKMDLKNIKIIIPDTSVIVDGAFSHLLYEETNVKVVIPYAVIDELHSLALKKRELGGFGVDELDKIRSICDKKNIVILFEGERLSDVHLRQNELIDNIIIGVAKHYKGVLYTSDVIQSKVAKIQGVPSKLLLERETKELHFESFFSSNTLSIHLKESVSPLGKIGKPGQFELVTLRKDPCSREELDLIIKEIMNAIGTRNNAFVEIDMSGAMVIQLSQYRIAIARPPFSDGIEITIVRPIIELKLEDYSLSDKLMERFKGRAEGILVAGPPGSGKTTFASSLADFFSKLGKIVKTLESPRDLQVGPHITQYAPLEGSFENTADILLLVRPDYSIFDEIRKTKDFDVFADLRSAGVGMIGVIHATNPIDAIQRFMSRIEIGVIPHIVDTVIYILDGRVEAVFTLSMVIRVPSGMMDMGLARPIVEVKNLETDKLHYEIYTFGEENIIVPVDIQQESAIEKFTQEKILQRIKRYDPYAKVNIIASNRALIKVNEKTIPRLIGRRGERIARLEKSLGLKLDVEPRDMINEESLIPFQLKESKSSYIFTVDRRYIGQSIMLKIDKQDLMILKMPKKNRISIPLRSKEGRIIEKALKMLKEISLVEVKDTIR
jgi:ATPase